VIAGNAFLVGSIEGIPERLGPGEDVERRGPGSSFSDGGDERRAGAEERLRPPQT